MRAHTPMICYEWVRTSWNSTHSKPCHSTSYFIIFYFSGLGWVFRVFIFFDSSLQFEAWMWLKVIGVRGNAQETGSLTVPISGYVNSLDIRWHPQYFQTPDVWVQQIMVHPGIHRGLSVKVNSCWVERLKNGKDETMWSPNNNLCQYSW